MATHQNPRDVLFAGVAIALGLVSPHALKDCLANSNRGLVEELRNRSLITVEEIGLVESLVQQSLSRNPNFSIREFLDGLSSSLQNQLSEAFGKDGLFDVEGTQLYEPIEIAEPKQNQAQHEGGRFKILHLHARGGLGEVYLAEDLDVRRRVALKQIQGRYVDNESNRQRFLSEAHITASLEHPGIIPIYGLGHQSDGSPFYAMRFIHGNDLQKSIRDFHAEKKFTASARNLAFRNLLRRFIDVCNAIAFAHSRGILHRDLKPGNVMVGEFGETLVVDWGLAKKTASVAAPNVMEHQQQTEFATAYETQPGQFLGTPAFMSPEQAEGRLDDLGPASDIYSLGAMLYTLLVGKPPFEGAILEVIADVKSGKLKAPQEVIPNVPSALNAVCMNAMSLYPVDRYQTALEMAEDIESWLADEPVKVYRDSMFTRVARWGRKHPAIVAACTAIIVTTTIALGGGIWAVSIEQAKTLKEKNAAVASDKRSYGALMAVTDDVVSQLMLRKSAVTQREREFIERIQSLFEDLVSGDDQSENSRLSRAEGLVRLADISVKLGLSEKSLAALRQAVHEFDDLSRDFPLNENYLLRATEYRNILGGVLVEQGQLVEAASLLETSSQTLADVASNSTSNIRGQLTGAKGLTRLARLRELQGEKVTSAELFEKACRQVNDLVEQQPADEFLIEALAEIESSTSRFYHEHGNAAQAINHSRNSVSRLKKLLDDEKKPSESMRRIYVDKLSVLISGLIVTGQAAEAESSIREAIAIYQQLIQDYPADADMQYSLAVLFNNYSALMFDAKEQRAKAFDAQDQSVKLYDRLLVLYPDSISFREARADAIVNKGNLYRFDGQHTLAQQAYDQAVLEYKVLKGLAPDSPLINHRFAVALNANAVLKSDQALHADAEALLDEAIAICNQLIKEDGENASAYADLGNALTNRARARLALGNTLGSVSDISKAGAAQANAMKLQPKLEARNLSQGSELILNFLKNGNSSMKKSP